MRMSNLQLIILVKFPISKNVSEAKLKFFIRYDLDCENSSQKNLKRTLNSQKEIISQ